MPLPTGTQQLVCIPVHVPQEDAYSTAPALCNLGNCLGTEAIYWYIHTCVFDVTCTPIHPFPPICYYLYLFGPLPPQMVHLLPVPNMEWAVYEF